LSHVGSRWITKSVHGKSACRQFNSAPGHHIPLVKRLVRGATAKLFGRPAATLRHVCSIFVPMGRYGQPASCPPTGDTRYRSSVPVYRALPNHRHRPAQLIQFASDSAIPGTVGRKFSFPIRNIAGAKALAPSGIADDALPLPSERGRPDLSEGQAHLHRSPAKGAYLVRTGTALPRPIWSCTVSIDRSGRSKSCYDPGSKNGGRGGTLNRS
jgi:hypothetical protein